MRAFVAVEMSEPIRRALAGLIEQLQQFHAPVKWVSAENIHLTLKFLGNVPDAAVPQVTDMLIHCCRNVARFQLEIAGVGAFPNLARPRVLFARASDHPPTLAPLARDLNRRMTRAGVPRETRPFKSHLTLGRVRRPQPAPDMAEKLTQLADRPFGAMTVDRVVLMESRLTPTGPIYTPLESVPLATDSPRVSDRRE